MRLRVLLAVAALAAASLSAKPVDWATVTVATSPDGVRLAYDLPRPVTRLAFSDDADNSRPERWTVLTSGVALKGDTLTSAEPFRHVEIRVAPDTREVDRLYPALARLGTGYVVHGPYLILKGIETRLRTRPVQGETVVTAAEPLGAVVYIGPKRYIKRVPRAKVIAAPDLPAWLRERIASEAAPAMAFYQSALDSRPIEDPTLIIAHYPSDVMNVRADVTGRHTVFFRFRGDAWKTADGQHEADKLILHESFHLWDPGGAEQDTFPWIHEGMAEYGSIVAGASLGLYSDAQVREEIGTNLGHCRNALGDKPLSQASIKKGRAVYTCGTVLEWLADLDARQGGSDFYGLWKGLIRSAPPGGYTLATFRAATPAEGLARQLVDGQGPQRWTALEAALRARGVAFRAEPSGDAYRTAILFHLERQHCGTAQIGFFTQSDNLKLDTGARCGPMAGDPEIVAIEKASLFGRPADAYAAAKARCAAGEPVRLTRKQGGEEIVVPCNKPLPAPDMGYVIERLPSLVVTPARARP